MTALRDWTATVRTHDPVPESAPEGASETLALRVGAERQRMALALHDEVAPLLFAMASRIGRALDDPAGTARPDDDGLRSTLRTLDAELRAVQQRLRAVIRSCGPEEAPDALHAVTQRDIEAFTERTGVPAHLVLRGRPVPLPPAPERVVLHCLRQGLVNVERHARAGLAVVTLDYRSDRVRLVVQDDGLGLPVGFVPRVVPVDGHWGFTSMAEQVERLGGTVLLRRLDEGGTQLLVELPVDR